MQYLLLTTAIVSEVIATLSLRTAARGRPAFYALAAAGYTLAFAMLNGSLRHGMPLGIAYGIWVAAGTATIAVASRYLFGEPLTRRMLAGIALISGGVLCVELGAMH